MFQFVLFKFLTYGGQELTPQDDELYEVGLATWITILDENMIGKIKWPSFGVGNFVRKEKPACADWKEELISVRRFYDTYIHAATSCKGVIEDSTYETDKELGRGKRKKKRVAHFDSESDKESDNERTFTATSKKIKKDADVLKYTKKILPPPPVPAPPFKNTVSPEKITRQNIKQPEKPYVLNSSVSEPLKETRVNYVVKNIREKKQQETDKRAELLEKLKKCKNEKQHRTEQIANLFSMRNTVQEPKYNKVQEITESSLRAVAEETSLTDDGVDNHNTNSSCDIQPNKQFSIKKSVTSAGSLSPSPSCSSNYTSNINSPHRHLFQTAEKSYYSSPSKSPSSESYHGHHIIPSEIERRNSSAFCTQESSSLQSTTLHETNKENSSVQALLVNYIHKLDENMKIINRVDSKLDIAIMNQEKLCRHLLLGEKLDQRPTGLPSFPIQTQDELDRMEKFLEDDNNLSSASFYFARYIDAKSVENSVRKLLAKLVGNSLGSNYSFYGSRVKRTFEKLKIWELAQGALLTCFEAKDMKICEKVASTWLANAPWRKGNGASVRQRPDNLQSLKTKKKQSPQHFQ